LAHVICPPYDIISSGQQSLYYRKSTYNAIRLELPREDPGPAVDRYQKAAATFGQWLMDGILEQDSVPGFYLHQHQFDYSGEERLRRGLIARVRLEPWGNGIYPHEETGTKAEGDRLQLMRSCRANFSPLLSLYDDSHVKVSATLSRISRQEPLISLWAEPSNLPDCHEVHTLWAVTDLETKQELSRLLSSVPLYMADGHHRYETALAYQREKALQQCSGD
jgi:uncharacterized protein (DUF1015 family)